MASSMEEGAPNDDPGTGLEEPMWQLSLGEPDYPRRPGEPNCDYYMRTGSCGYGEKCRYNHPQNRFTETGYYPERVGQSLCQYFMKTGTCKFGASCKYHHPRRGGPANPVQLNSSGYPLRLEERECSYYMKTGLCKFGASCKFNHPELTGGSAATVLTGPTYFPAVQSQSTVSSGQLPAIASWQLSPGSYFPGSYGPTLFIPGVVPFSGWSPYPSSVNPAQSGAAYLPLSSVSSSGSVQQENIFPERLGQPECQYYIRTGSCKFGSTCKYHHPREWGASKINCSLSLLGLPLRPGTSACAFYMQHGQCKFGPSCKYDHPMGTLMGYTPSASSLSNTPLVSFPIGNVSLPSTTAQALSTLSSQDERHRLKPG